MISALLALCTLLPQTAQRRNPLTRSLPHDRTLLCVEVPDPKALLAHREQIAQLSCFDLRSAQRLLDWIGRQEDGISRVIGERDTILDLLGDFDRGLALTQLFVERKIKEGSDKTEFASEDFNRQQPRTVFLGMSSKASALREHHARIAKLLASISEGSDQGNDPRVLHSDEVPLLDSPVSAHLARRYKDDTDETRHWYGYMPYVSYAYKGRTAAFQVSQEWHRDKKGRLALDDIALELLGSGLGLMGGERGGSELGERYALGEGETLLARLVVRFDAIASRPGGVSERSRAEMVGFGMDDFVGVKALLLAKADELHERVEILLKGKEHSPLRIPEPRGTSLGEVAKLLPPDTLFALRTAWTPKVLEDYSYGLTALEWIRESEVAEFFDYTRRILGLGKAEGTARTFIGEVDEVVVCALPGAPGSFLPEPAVLVKTTARAGEEKATLTAIGELILEGIRGSAAKEGLPSLIKTLGKGDKAVPYLRITDLMGDGGMGMGQIELKLMGGGFFSAKRVGDWFVIGFNPRTVRKFARAAAGGKALAQRPRFLERFPADAKRAIECWVDGPALVRSLTGLSTIFPFIMLAGPGGAIDLPPRPTVKELSGLFSEEWVWTRHEEKRIVFEHGGGTLLSPIAWTVFGYGCYSVDVLGSLLR